MNPGFCVLITILLLHGVANCNAYSISYTIASGNSHTSVTEYTMHAPISIVGNSELSVWPGSGTKEDPYVIQGRVITDSSICIEIISTTAYFEIRNCRISSDVLSGNPGIHFQNVAHGSIINCIIDSHEDGILVEVSDNCAFLENTVISNSRNGIYLHGSDDCVLKNNIVANNTRNGIAVSSGWRCTLINNTATNNVDGFNLNSVLDGCTFENNTSIDNRGDGVYIDDCDNCNLTSNRVIGGSEGVVIWSSSTCRLVNNTVTNSSNTGLYLYGASGSILTDNTVTGSLRGLYFYLTSSCTLTNNALLNTGLVISGTSTSHWLHTMSSNWVNNKPLGYFRDLASSSIDGSSYGQVILANCIDVTVENATVHNASRGFQVGYSTDCRLSSSTSSRNGYGFYLWGSTNCIISDSIASNSSSYGFLIDNSPGSILLNNSAFNSEDGFHIEESESCNLTLNTAINNLAEGFYLHWSDNCILMNNSASKSEEGIEIAVSNYCELSNNNATDNQQGFVVSADDTILTNNTASNNENEGFYFISTFYSCTLLNNTATNNSDGFYLQGFPSSILTNNTASNNLDDGFCIRSSSGCTLTNNTARDNEDAGIYLQGSQGSTIVNNTFENNGLAISGSSLSQWLHTMSDNRVNDRPLGYFRDLVGGSIDAGPYGQVILANCQDVIVQHAIISNATVGLMIGHSTNCTLTNNTAVMNSASGFFSSYTDTCKFVNNTASNNSGNGYYIHSSNLFILDNNTACCNGASVYLYSSTSCTLANNTFLKNGLVIGGSSKSHWLHSISENWVNDKPLGYFRDLVSGIIDASPFGQVILANCSGVIVHGGVVSDATVGFQLGYSEDSKLMNNIAPSNRYGFYLRDSINCTLTENTASSNSEYGYFLHSSTNCHLIDNHAFSNLMDGFYIYESDICNLSDNRAKNNLNNGFYLYGSDYCILVNNTASQNSNDGFSLLGCSDCTVDNCSAVENSHGYRFEVSYRSILIDTLSSNNNHDGFYLHAVFDSIFNNNTAIDNLEDGVYLGSTSDNCTLTENEIANNAGCGILFGRDTSGNYIYHNVIEMNGINAWDDGISNIWDDGVSLGNFWGDFEWGDFYTVPGTAGSIDRYPFAAEAYYSVFLDHPEDIEYEYGTLGHYIIWHPSDPHPDSYEILRNESQVSISSWNGSHVRINVDNLSLGTHIYTLTVYDTSGYSASDTVFVIVVDTASPVINHPEDIQYVEGTTNHSITWIATDLNPDLYEIYRNGNIVASGIWNGSEISINVDGLDVGTYNYTVLASDASSNIVRDTVFVTVTSFDTPTTTSTTEPTSRPEEILPFPIMALVASALGVVVILIIVYIKKG